MISAILLAAGQSLRMKGENKLVKEINGVPLVKLAAKIAVRCVDVPVSSCVR